MNCPNCSAEMIPLFTSFVCKDECDLKKQSSVLSNLKDVYFTLDHCGGVTHANRRYEIDEIVTGYCASLDLEDLKRHFPDRRFVAVTPVDKDEVKVAFPEHTFPYTFGNKGFKVIELLD